MYCQALLHKFQISFDPEFNEELKTWDFSTLCKALSSKVSGMLSPEEIAEDFDAYLMDFYSNRVNPMPGVVEYIQEVHARGIRKCIVTASPRRHIQPALLHLGLRTCFEHIISPEMVGDRDKSQPDIYRKAMELMNHTKAEDYCVFDDAEGAVRTASSLKMFTVGVADPVVPDQQGLQKACDLFLRDFRELLPLR